jgi:hypothetical protein
MDSSHALPDEKIHRSHLARYTVGLVLAVGYRGMQNSTIRPRRRDGRKLKSKTAKQANAAKLFCAGE